MAMRREQKYAITDEELRPYFSLPNVLEGLFGVSIPRRGTGRTQNRVCKRTLPLSARLNNCEQIGRGGCGVGALIVQR